MGSAKTAVMRRVVLGWAYERMKKKRKKKMFISPRKLWRIIIFRALSRFGRDQITRSSGVNNTRTRTLGCIYIQYPTLYYIV